MYVCTSEIVKKANKIVDICGTRDPHRIAKDLGIEFGLDASIGLYQSNWFSRADNCA